MRFFAPIFVVLMAFAAVGTAHAQVPPKLDEKALRVAMEDALKDADSAKFKDIQYKAGETPGAWTMCGSVNAKNAYGGYAGFERFAGFVAKDGKKVTYIVLRVGGVSDEYCASKGMP